MSFLKSLNFSIKLETKGKYRPSGWQVQCKGPRGPDRGSPPCSAWKSRNFGTVPPPTPPHLIPVIPLRETESCALQRALAQEEKKNTKKIKKISSRKSCSVLFWFPSGRDVSGVPPKSSSLSYHLLRVFKENKQKKERKKKSLEASIISKDLH